MVNNSWLIYLQFCWPKVFQKVVIVWDWWDLSVNLSSWFLAPVSSKRRAWPLPSWGLSFFFCTMMMCVRLMLSMALGFSTWIYLFFMIFKNSFLLNWIIALQCLVGFCQTTIWISRRYWICFLLNRKYNLWSPALTDVPCISQRFCRHLSWIQEPGKKSVVLNSGMNGVGQRTLHTCPPQRLFVCFITWNRILRYVGPGLCV